jgi:hypothetical protein
MVENRSKGGLIEGLLREIALPHPARLVPTAMLDLAG